MIQLSLFAQEVVENKKIEENETLNETGNGTLGPNVEIYGRTRLKIS